MDSFDLMESHLNKVKERLVGQEFSPALPERLKTFELTLSQLSCQVSRRKQEPGREYEIRSVAAPVYGTDLGVRFDRDPSEFYGTHCGFARVEPLSPAVLTRALLDCDTRFLGMLIDSVLLFFGDYRAVKDAVSERYDEIIYGGDYGTQISAGVVMAALGDKHALRLFETVADNEAVSLSDRYGALHRRRLRS
ncbi:MAG: hypothetical protein Q3979_09330 [Actinomycetaceae bacterium]|nr:hypothetical protein [Actinomycetaceae bacterium]